MTTTPRSAECTSRFHDRIESTVSRFTPGWTHVTHRVPHRRKRPLAASQATAPREVELWGLTDLPDDVSISHYGPATRDVVESILVPIAGGPNSHATVRVSVEVARDLDARLELLTVVAAGADSARRMKAEARLHNHANGISGVRTELDVVASDDVVSTIDRRSQEHALIVIGDSERSVFRRIFTGSVPKRLTEGTDVPIIVVEQAE
jgi:K+-sensing histidine kinase KdpD